MNIPPQASIPLLKSSDILKDFDSRGVIPDFLDFLRETNKKFNLVSRETSREEINRLAADSLAPLALGAILEGSFIDIGSGGGFPALILLLVKPELSAVLYERTQKKARFLAEAVKRYNARAEVIPGDFVSTVTGQVQGGFDFATLKLVTPDKSILSGLADTLRPGAPLYYYGDYKRVAPNAASGLFDINYRPYYLDNSEQLRTLTIFSRKS